MMRIPIQIALSLAACSPASIELGEDSTQGSHTGTTPPTEAGFEAEIEEVTGVDTETLSEWIYDPEVMHHLDITMSQDSLIALYSESEAYNSTYWVEADITYDGEAVEQVGVRLKGRWGSWRNVDAKAAFKIDFNRYVDGQVFHGLKGLTLNNMVIDYSYMHERLAYEVYEVMGVPSPRNAYTWVTLNGTDYGLYLNVETADDVYIMWNDGSYTVLDFYTSLAMYFEQEEGEDIGSADLIGVAEMLDENEGSSTFYEDSSVLIDWEYHQRQMACEMWTGQIDGYSLNQNNYLVYFNPEDGRASVLPWDHDYAFLHASAWGFSWRSPRGRLSENCVASPACREALQEQIIAVNEAVEDLDLSSQIEEINTLIWPYIQADPRKEAGMDYTQYYQDVLKLWVETRSQELESMWGL
jgi:hypothetical protein